jgi:hypothetical protein
MSEPTGSSLPVALQTRREQTITALCGHFAQDRLTLEEFEHRLDVANRASTLPDLDSLLADLPALAGDVPAPAPPPALPSSHLREDQTLFAIMGGVDRHGRWQPARNTTVITLMGGASLDFRDALLPPGETEVTVIAVMGGAEIIVPPGMHVDVGGLAIMGGFDHAENVSSPPDPSAPLLRVNGFVLMGGVDVQVRLAGETAKDTKRREREEQRRQRDQRRRR